MQRANLFSATADGFFSVVFDNKKCLCVCVSACVEVWVSFLCATHSQLDAYSIIRFRTKGICTLFPLPLHRFGSVWFGIVSFHLFGDIVLRIGCSNRSVCLCEFGFYSVCSTSASDCEDVMTALWSLLSKQAKDLECDNVCSPSLLHWLLFADNGIVGYHGLWINTYTADNNKSK